MMETVIPSQVGTSLRTLQKNKRGQRSPNKKERPKKPTKKMREKREGAMLLSFFHTCASK
jgi:hypothetical protein